MEERLQKFMAGCGVASRRKCEELITNGSVRVNESIVKNLGFKVDPSRDKVYVDNRLIRPVAKKIYIALHKPVGYVSTVKDERNRPTIIDLINLNERIYPIGRLDYDTSGLILLTNDGEIYNKIIHPREVINKVYIATVRGFLTKDNMDKFNKGIDIGGYITAPAKIEVLRQIQGNSEVKITIHEGKNRQIRRMCDAIDHPVINLKRISVGNIELGNLKYSEWRYLNDREIKYIGQL
jgi:23S rRNA pseudouridine2605 synthase